MLELLPFFHKIFKILILFVLYFKNYKRQIVSWNCKHVQHVKIYLPCNVEVNLITHLGVIALFPHFFFISILFVLYFKNYLEIDVMHINSTLYQNAVFWLVDERGIFFTNSSFFQLFHHCRDIFLKISRYYRNISRFFLFS